MIARKEELRERLTAVRERTLWLFQLVPDEFLRRRVHSFYSPIGWHFGHVGRTEEYWIVGEAMHQPPIDERLSFLYADRPDNPKDNRVHIPDRAGTLRYLRETRTAVLEALDRADLESDDPFRRDGYAWEFAIQHEYQHQETILEMLCLIHREIGPKPVQAMAWKSDRRAEFREFPAQSFAMGSDDPHGYDNEKAAHAVEVGAFRLATRPVSAFEWTEFIGDGGYQRRELWSREGWAWREAEDATRPEYWLAPKDGGWSTYGPTGVRAIDPDEPAASLSYHEALAFATWRGLRLPTEVEWECARHSASEPHVMADRLGPDPANVGLAGSIWQWTGSPFLPYPGFVAFPYDGYSKDHMRGQHMVCRGGSWATAKPILRPTFRNWYVPTYRQGFLGVRLAE